MKWIHEEILRLAKPHLDTRDNKIHTEMSIEFAYKLLAQEGGDENVVIPAIILHDVGWKRVPEDLQLKTFGPKATLPELAHMHEDESVKIAQEILEKVNYEEDKAEEIINIVGGHDSRKEPISLNDKVVKDADKLFRYTKEYVKIFTKRFDMTYNQMMDRLERKLTVWFLTKSGREMARTALESRFKERKN